jgi:TPP-dependent pyruvate/acetoin dehydrogenase alpha subunit
MLDQHVLDKIRLEAEKEVAAAHLFAQNSLPPDQRELLKYVYR